MHAMAICKTKLFPKFSNIMAFSIYLLLYIKTIAMISTIIFHMFLPCILLCGVGQQLIEQQGSHFKLQAQKPYIFHTPISHSPIFSMHRADSRTPPYHIPKWVILSLMEIKDNPNKAFHKQIDHVLPHFLTILPSNEVLLCCLMMLYSCVASSSSKATPDQELIL